MIQPKLFQSNGQAHVPNMIVFVAPGQRNVLKAHFYNIQQFWPVAIITQRSDSEVGMPRNSFPSSLDPLLYEDDLFQALSRSEYTSSLLGLRAREILTVISRQVMESKIAQECLQLSQNIQQLVRKNQGLNHSVRQKQELLKAVELQKKQQRQKAEEQNLKLSETYEKEIRVKDEKIEELSFQVDEVKAEISRLNQAGREKQYRLKQQIVDLEEKVQREQGKVKKTNQDRAWLKEENQKLSEALKQSKAELDALSLALKGHIDKQKIQQQGRLTTQSIQQWSKIQQSISEKDKALTRKSLQLQELQKQLRTKTEQLKKREEELRLKQQELKKIYAKNDKLKLELSEAQTNYKVLRTQISKFREKYKKFEADYHHLQKNHKKQIQQAKEALGHMQTQKMVLKAEVNSLTLTIKDLKRKAYSKEKTLQGQIRQLAFSISWLKQENLGLQSQIVLQIGNLKEQTEATITKVVNHLSKELGQYFQECCFQLKREREEKQLARQEVKLKNQVIQHFQKLLSNESQSIYQLRNELRAKKKEEEKLRKKLKQHYLETDRKLEEFQQKYVSILKDEP